MKKVLFTILLFILTTCTPVYAACWQCQDATIDGVKYDAIHDYHFDIQTGEGLCKGLKSRGITMKLCDCENIDQLSTKKEYVIILSLETEGVYFSKPATEVDLSYSTYSKEEDACGGSNPTYKTSLSYSVNSEGTKVFTKKAHLMQPLSPFITVAVPEMYYDVDKVTPSTKVYVKMGIAEPGAICPDCDDLLCSCVQPVAIIGCYQCKASLQYVVLNSEDWWTGLAITNRNDFPCPCILQLVTVDSTLTKYVTIPSNSVFSRTIATLFPDAKNQVGYLDILSVSRLDALCIMGSQSGIYAMPAINCCSCLTK